MAFPASSPGSRPRRQRLIVEGFQTRFLVMQLVWIAAWGAMFAAGVFGPILRPVLLDRNAPLDPAGASALLVLHNHLWLPLLFASCGLIFVLMRETHRVAGPLYRFRQVFKRIGSGDLSVRVRIRENDYLTDEAAELDHMIRQLSDRAARVDSACDSLSDAVTSAAASGEITPDCHARLEAALAQVRLELEASRTPAPPRATNGPASAGVAAAADQSGFSLIELAIAMGIVSVIAALGVPAYTGALDRARVTRAIGDINAVSKEITMASLTLGCLPGSLQDLGRQNLTDPWGRPYEYAVPRSPGGGGGGGRGRGGGGGAGGGGCAACGGACVAPGAARKDKNLVPINSDYDLFSSGSDGRSVAPLTAQQSHDDIVRGRDGGFVGLASDF